MAPETRRFLWALLLSGALVLLFIDPAMLPGLERFLPAAHLPMGLDKPLAALAWLSLAWAVSLGFEIFLWRRLFGAKTGGVPRQRQLFTDLFNAGVYAVALLIVATNVFGVQVTGVLATSGVVAVILGFAMQQVLADLFAGLALNMERPFRAGDWISLDADTQGLVLLTNWRATHIRTRSGDLLVVPNGMIARGRVVNHSLPVRTHLAMVEFHLTYGFDGAAIQQAVRDAALTVDGVLKEPPPIVLLHAMAPQFCAWRVHVFIEDFGRLVLIKGAVAQAVHAALSQPAFAGALPRQDIFVHKVAERGN